MKNAIRRTTFYAILLFAAIGTGLYVLAVQKIDSASDFGSFTGNPKIELLAGQNVRLIASLTYTDPKDRDWPVPALYEFDGASIPKVFWSLVGGPLDGPYRDAAIIHDYYCENFRKLWKEDYKRSWKEVHRMFYFAMRSRGVDEETAKLMFAAVFHFGPRWEWNGEQVRKIQVQRVLGRDTALEDNLRTFITATNPDLENIEAFKIGGIPPAGYVPQGWTSGEH